MSKMKKRMIGIGLILAVIIVGMIALVSKRNTNEDGGTPNQTRFASETDDSQESGLPDSSEGKPYGVLYDVVVSAEHTADDTVKITLTNTSAFAVTKWAVAYESSYDIVTIENAKLLLNSNKVKQFMVLDENDTLESGDCITITLEIDGTYHSDTRYRVYGSSEGLSENTYVYDLITTHGATGETSLEIYDAEDIAQGPTTTQGLDVN